MPMAKARSVAAASHGSTRSTSARKRDGLARSIRVIATFLELRQFLVVRGAGGNEANGRNSRFHDHVTTAFRSSTASFESLPQGDGGGERPDHEADQSQRTQHGERRAEWNRPDDRRVRGRNTEDKYRHGQGQH